MSQSASYKEPIIIKLEKGRKFDFQSYKKSKDKEESQVNNVLSKAQYSIFNFNFFPQLSFKIVEVIVSIVFFVLLYLR